MATFEFSLKGRASYTKREIEIEEFKAKVEMAEGENEKYCDTISNAINSINETNRFSERKDREIERIQKLGDEIKEQKRVIQLKVDEILPVLKNAVGDFKFESAEAKKSLIAILKNIVENSSMSREEKDKIGNEIYNIANGYAKASSKINSIFNKYENR